MKRIITLVLAAAMAVSLFSGCKKEEAVIAKEQFAQESTVATVSKSLEVETAIAQIGDISMRSGSAIYCARAMYDALPAEERATVSNLNVLNAAEEDYQSCQNAEGKFFFDPGRMPNRYETAFMLVRMLDKELEAVNGDWTMPFTDVEDWAEPYVGYAYVNGLMDGISETAFDGNGTVTAPEYMTLILKALGYENFTPETVWELSDAHGLTKGQYAADSTEFAPGDLEKIFLKACEVHYVMANATAWGLPDDIRWITAPKTLEDVDNNIQFAFLVGNYSLNFTNLSEVNEGNLPTTIQKRYSALTDAIPELFGAYSNGRRTVRTNPEGVLTLKFEKRSLSEEEVYAQQLAALEVAKHIKAELHQGKITSNMTQLEIAQVYYDYLQNLRTSPGDGPEATADGRCVEFDTPYAILVNRKGDCVGRAGTFNLLMHLEGIESQGLTGGVKSVGGDGSHIISRVILDGVTYYCDWFPMNRQPLTSEAESWFEIRPSNR